MMTKEGRFAWSQPVGDGNFQLFLIRKHERRFTAFDDKTITVY